MSVLVVVVAVWLGCTGKHAKLQTHAATTRVGYSSVSVEHSANMASVTVRREISAAKRLDGSS